MSKLRRKALPVNKTCSFLLLLALSVGSLFAADGPAPRKAPELAFTLPGVGPKLLSQYRGKVVAIEFIMTTCPHCQAAAKVMTQYQKDYGSRGYQSIDLAINVLANNATPAAASQQVSAFASTYGAEFPVGFLPQDQMMSFMGFSIMDRMVVPQIVLIDRKGFIHYQTPAESGEEWDKVMNEAAMREHIEQLLGPASSTATHGAKSVHVASSGKGQ
jgi:thiol-disulfide isomerase/thioredoxin